MTGSKKKILKIHPQLARIYYMFSGASVLAAIFTASMMQWKGKSFGVWDLVWVTVAYGCLITYVTAQMQFGGFYEEKKVRR